VASGRQQFSIISGPGCRPSCPDTNPDETRGMGRVVRFGFVRTTRNTGPAARLRGNTPCFHRAGGASSEQGRFGVARPAQAPIHQHDPPRGQPKAVVTRDEARSSGRIRGVTSGGNAGRHGLPREPAGEWASAGAPIATTRRRGPRPCMRSASNHSSTAKVTGDRRGPKVFLSQGHAAHGIYARGLSRGRD